MGGDQLLGDQNPFVLSTSHYILYSIQILIEILLLLLKQNLLLRFEGFLRSLYVLDLHTKSSRAINDIRTLIY